MDDDAKPPRTILRPVDLGSAPSERDPLATAKLEYALARQQLAQIRVAQEERKLLRRSRITTWNEYISFGVCKAIGLAGLTLGGLEYLDPNFLSITLNNPGLIAGAGLALLTGKNIVALFAKLEKGRS